ncbi:MAG: hypothetical protein ACRDTM_17500 [Micromonosporaceae bacterium]
MQPYGAPPPPEPEVATSGTVKTAVALTMTAVLLAVVESIILVYLLQETIANDDMSNESLRSMKTWFGVLIGVNLILAAGLSGGAVLSLRRSVAGKAMIWGFGVVSMFMRLGCGGFSVLLSVIYETEADPGDLPFPIHLFWALIVIETLALLAILVAMIMLMTKGASFKQPGPGGPPGGYGGPPAGYGAPYSPGPGSPVAPPMSGPPTSAPPGGLPQLPPTPGWPGS